MSNKTLQIDTIQTSRYCLLCTQIDSIDSCLPLMTSDFRVGRGFKKPTNNGRFRVKSSDMLGRSRISIKKSLVG